MSHEHMHAWSSKLRQHMPDAAAVAVLGDARGYLVVVDRHPDAECMDSVEKALRKIGATGWHWTTDGDELKLRVYTDPAWRPWWWALTLLFPIIYYDILGITTAARIWLDQRW